MGFAAFLATLRQLIVVIATTVDVSLLIIAVPQDITLLLVSKGY